MENLVQLSESMQQFDALLADEEAGMVFNVAFGLQNLSDCRDREI